MSAARLRVLLLGEPPIYQTEMWDEFQKNYQVVSDTSATRDEFLEALKANKSVARITAIPLAFATR